MTTENIINDVKALKEVLWINPKYDKFETIKSSINISEKNIKDAEERLERFAPYIRKAFPETITTNGIIESKIHKIPNMRKRLEKEFNEKIFGQLLIKRDDNLPIAGSIKARGGIYEVLKLAENLAMENNLLTIEDDYSKLFEENYKDFFSNYTIQVGSTGNLGLSIGIISATLGFKVKVHMSQDAKQWKKDLLREKGVDVIEYTSDYSKAVEEGRKLSNKDPKSYFIDDENSVDLFMGYAVAAYRLKNQLEEMNILVNNEHPLFVYLPCGVGGGPGGVAFGLKQIYGDNVHCFFAEPTHSPAMLLGLATGLHDKVDVKDYGLDNITEADGLAVGKPSTFVGKIMEKLLSGAYTIEDEKLYKFIVALVEEENIYVEPSATAGFLGPIILSSNKGLDYIKEQNLLKYKDNITHICWSTGGSLIPKNIMDDYYIKGLKINKEG